MNPSSDTAPNIFPCLRYKDAPAAIEWLIRVFGFEKVMEIAEPDGMVAHAELRFGPGVVMLGSARGDQDAMSPPRGPESAKQSIYIALDDVDLHYQHARAAGVEIVAEVHDTDYDSREYTARDPEGNVWSFGTYRP